MAAPTVVLSQGIQTFGQTVRGQQLDYSTMYVKKHSGKGSYVLSVER